jgi:hypothetical protein
MVRLSARFVNSNRESYVPDDRIKAFWRDDVDLWVHSRQERIKKLLSVLFYLGLTGIGVYGLGKTAFPDGAWGIISGLASLVTALSLFCADLYFKGGKAGAELKGKLNDLASADPAIQEDRINAIQDAVMRLQSILAEDSAHFPRGGSNLTLPQQQAEAISRLKNDVRECLTRCNEQTDGFFHRTLSFDPIEPLSDHTALVRAVQHTIGKMVFAVERIG